MSTASERPHTPPHAPCETLLSIEPQTRTATAKDAAMTPTEDTAVETVEASHTNSALGPARRAGRNQRSIHRSVLKLEIGEVHGVRAVDVAVEKEGSGGVRRRL